MKIYIYLAAAIAIMGLLGAGVWFTYNAGISHERAEQAANREKEAKKDEAKVEKVIEYRDKIKVIYRDKIKLIKSAKDTTGCADTKLTDMGFSLHTRPD